MSKESQGQNLIDPLRNPAHSSTTLKNFKSNPLFAADGPSMDDIFQGEVGDCYFVAPLSAIAEANPEFIKRMVVELGDGTYAVRFYNNGSPVFVRVDGDLWAQNSIPKYAGLGREGSIWVPIVEKAYCFFRKQVELLPVDRQRQRLRGRTPQRHQAHQGNRRLRDRVAGDRLG